jgi:hypothetical protein
MHVPVASGYFDFLSQQKYLKKGVSNHLAPNKPKNPNPLIFQSKYRELKFLMAGPSYKMSSCDHIFKYVILGDRG